MSTLNKACGFAPKIFCGGGTCIIYVYICGCNTCPIEFVGIYLTCHISDELGEGLQGICR